MSETTQLTSNNTEFEDDCEEEREPLNKSLTSMDWLQKLNADYVTQTNSDNTIKVENSYGLEEPDSSTSCDHTAQCGNCSKNVSHSTNFSPLLIPMIIGLVYVK